MLLRKSSTCLHVSYHASPYSITVLLNGAAAQRTKWTIYPKFSGVVMRGISAWETNNGESVVTVIRDAPLPGKRFLFSDTCTFGVNLRHTQPLSMEHNYLSFMY